MRFIYGDEGDLLGYVDVYGADKNDYLAYLLKLEEAGFTVEKDDDNLTATAEIINGQYKNKLEVYFDEPEELIHLTYYINSVIIPFTEWPAELVTANIRNRFGEDTIDTLPAYSGTNGKGYLVNGNVIKILTDGDWSLASDIIEAYKTDLEAAGFTLDEDEYAYVSPNEEFIVALNTDENNDAEIYIGDVPEPVIHYEEFRVEVLQELLGNCADSLLIPVLAGADYYEEYVAYFDIDATDHYGTIIGFFTGEDGSETFTNYIALLNKAGFTVINVYTNEISLNSPSEEFMLKVSLGQEDDYYYIEVYVDDYDSEGNL